MTGQVVMLARPPATERAVVCFPHAGGTPSFFHGWAEALGPGVAVAAVAYGGDPPPETLDALADRIAAELATTIHRPTMLFGHSMGAVVAHEVAMRLHAAGPGSALQLVVSGAAAPGLRARTAVHRRDDAGLIAELGRLGGTDDALFTDPAHQRAWLPVIRADFRLIETHEHSTPHVLACPVTAVRGDRDDEVSLAEAQAWRPVTRGPFRMRTLPGGHFYLVARRAALLEQLRRQLTPHTPHITASTP